MNGLKEHTQGKLGIQSPNLRASTRKIQNVHGFLQGTPHPALAICESYFGVPSSSILRS